MSRIIGNIVDTQDFIYSIRNIKSSDLTILPLRKKSSKPFPDWVQNQEIRLHNETEYKKYKRSLFKDIFRKPPAYCGIYFLFINGNANQNYYYIGMAEPLERRLREHLTRLDFIFYSIAFPENIDIYYKESMRFYGDGLYGKYKDEYHRQFEGLKVSGINNIAWISSSAFSYSEWDNIETYFISKYQPYVNIAKKNDVPNQRYSKLYNETEDYLKRKILNIM
jgi:hypothetical protein